MYKTAGQIGTTKWNWTGQVTKTSIIGVISQVELVSDKETRAESVDYISSTVLK